MKQATVFNIQKFSIHDGPGIRTVIFLKGCGLKCQWCANPESQSIHPELYQVKSKCIGCGACINVCPHGALSAGSDGIAVDRTKCTGCGKCAEECYAKALILKGQTYTTDEIVEKIAKDASFYENSGGGYTLSGGEPLMQVDFCIELAEKCAKAGYHGCIETCGNGNTEKFKKLAGLLDLVFFDVKHANSDIHKSVTGVSNEPILKNLEAIQETANNIIVRTPVIPGINDSEENIIEIAKICSRMSKVSAWELLPYHRLGEYKYESLGLPYSLTGTMPPPKEQMQHFVDLANSILEPCGKQCILNTSSTG